MEANGVRIVDIGRGPQLEGHRLTVLDVFYYVHRGYEFDAIRDAMPSLTREQFDAIAAYIEDHYDELVEKDHRIEEFHKRGIETQQARGGIFAECEQHLTTQERVARLEQKLQQKLAEKNGARHSL
jgi:uncharacterized protein (DUF433 family)